MPTKVVRDFDQLWCWRGPEAETLLPGYRQCQKCRLGHPKHIRGCPTEELKKDIEDLRLIQKDKNISDEVYREYLAEVDQRVGEFLMCIEGFNSFLPWLEHAANLLNTTAAKLREVWEDAKCDLKIEMDEAERQAKDPNRKRLELIPEGDDDVRT